MNYAIASGASGHMLLLRINDLNNINLEHGREYGDKIIKNLAVVLEIVAKKYKIYHMDYADYTIQSFLFLE